MKPTRNQKLQAKKPLWKLLTTIRRAAPDKLAEVQRLRELAFWRCFAFYAERENGISGALFSQSIAEDIEKVAREHAQATPVAPKAETGWTKAITAWRTQTASIHALADRANRANTAYNDRSTARFESARREAWFLFVDADRAVIKAGGKSALEEEYFPGVPDCLNVRLAELGDLSEAL